MNITVIIGEDDYLVDSAAKKAIGDVGNGLEIIDSRTSTNEDSQLKDILAADASFSTPPFLDPVKATWWRNVGFLPSGGSKQSAESVKLALEKFAKKIASSSLPENQKFVISGPKLLQSSIVAKTLKSAAEMITFATGKYAKDKLQAASLRVAELAPEVGVSFAPGAIDTFVAIVGDDTRSIMNELAKLRDYLGNEKRAITRDDIATISSAGVGIEPEMWGVTDAIGERNFAKASQALRPFEQQNGFAIFATSAIEKYLRQLLAIKDAQAKGKLAIATKGMNPYAAQKMARFAANWTLNELRSARLQFLAIREKSVSSGGDTTPLVTITLAKICTRSRI